jgi:hypothetical protein
LSTINFYEFAPIMYQLKLVQDEIEELREFVSTELATTGSVSPVLESLNTFTSSLNIDSSAQGLLFTTGSKGKSTLLTIQVGKSIFQLTSIT